MTRHFDPLRPHRSIGEAEPYEFTHGKDSICVFDLRSLGFVTEVPCGRRPDCHATSLDNRYLYMACGGDDGGGLWCLDQRTLKIGKVVETGLVFATNALPDGGTMFLHDSFGGILVLTDIHDMARIRVKQRVVVHARRAWGDTIGGKGALIEEGRRYLCAGWKHPALYAVEVSGDHRCETFLEDPVLSNGDDVVVPADRTRAYVACYHDREESYVAVVDLAAREVTRRIRTGRGTCGLTMSNDERYVIASNDGDDSISVIETETEAVVSTVSAREGFERLGITGYIQGISMGQRDEVYVYGCSGNGALARFTDIPGRGAWAVSWREGEAESRPI